MPRSPLFLFMFVTFAPTIHVLCGEPELHVPACEQPTFISLDMPETLNFESPAPCRLVEIDHPEATVSGYIYRSMGADGLPAENRGRVSLCIPPRNRSEPLRIFHIEQSQTDAAADGAGFRLEDDGQKWMQLFEKDKPVFRYNYGDISADYVPEGDSRRTRSCYVHPLWGLDGEVLSDDFPNDHYHHHGLFWAWPRVEIGEKVYDLWKGLNIHHQFVRWLARDVSPVSAVLACENSWIAAGRTVMLERVWLQAYRSDGNSRILDLDIFWIATKEPVTLRGAFGKGYGGITMRYAPRRHTSISTSEGYCQGRPDQHHPQMGGFNGRFPGFHASRRGSVIYDSRIF